MTTYRDNLLTRRLYCGDRRHLPQPFQVGDPLHTLPVILGPMSERTGKKGAVIHDQLGDSHGSVVTEMAM